MNVARLIKKMSLKPNDVLVMYLPQDNPEEFRQACKMFEKVGARYPEVTIMVVPKGRKLQHLSEADMRRAGWVRAEIEPRVEDN